MSSPAQRRQRNSQSATPRSARQPAAQPAEMAASSPLFYQSSPAASGNGEVSSPLRQMSNSQSTQGQHGIPPSSPLRQMTESQDMGDGDRTPRASGMAGGMRYPELLLYNAVD